MRRIREMLRLHFEQGLSQRAMAQSVSVSRSTVSELLGRFKSLGLTWPLPPGLDDATLEARLYLGNLGQPRRCPEPDWNEIYRELRRKGVTWQLLWLECKERHPDGYQYSHFVNCIASGVANWT